jgi:hypothetical protein
MEIKMYLNDVALRVSESMIIYETDGDAMFKRRDEIASLLCDYVFETLAERNCGNGKWWGEPYEVRIPHEVYQLIQDIVAAAMIAQHKHDEEMWRNAMWRIEDYQADLVNGDVK